MAASGFPRNDWEVHSLYTFAGTSMWARPRHRGRVGTLAMLLRIARALPSATPALLRARPLVGRAVPAAVAASVGACVASSVRRRRHSACCRRSSQTSWQSNSILVTGEPFAIQRLEACAQAGRLIKRPDAAVRIPILGRVRGRGWVPEGATRVWDADGRWRLRHTVRCNGCPQPL